IGNKQVKGGYLLRYRRGIFCKGWSEEWVVLYEDSTLAWYSDKGLSRPRGCVRISEAPELLAVGEYTRQVPRRPRFPKTCQIGQLLAVGSRAFQDVHWLMAQSTAEINDWMTAISNTLPPPPTLTLDNKRLSLTSLQPKQDLGNSKKCNTHHMNGHAIPVPARPIASITTSQGAPLPSQRGRSGDSQQTTNRYDADHTVLSGVAIDWGHGWGWGQAAWVAQMCAVQSEAGAVGSSFHYHSSSAEDYTMGGCDEIDWSAFGDFGF
ncbi:unnamed protein product, partial [Callosobruchus maculatus]